MPLFYIIKISAQAVRKSPRILPVGGMSDSNRLKSSRVLGAGEPGAHWKEKLWNPKTIRIWPKCVYLTVDPNYVEHEAL